MKFGVELAGIPYSIHWLDETGNIAHVYKEIFKPFLSKSDTGWATLTISLAPESIGFPDFLVKWKKDDREAAIPNREIQYWLGQRLWSKSEFQTGTSPLCTGYLDGLLIYKPDTRRGRLYLLNRNLANIKCLYRLFWIFFAQTLGDKGGCFLHAAALVRNGVGYIFPGHSGSGKSTLTYTADNCMVFSDDSPIITGDKRGIHVSPSPFHQLESRERMPENTTGVFAEISGLYFIIQHPSAALERLEPYKALELIMKQHILFYPLLTTGARAKLFDLWLEACKNISTFKVLCPKNMDVFQIIKHPN